MVERIKPSPLFFLFLARRRKMLETNTLIDPSIMAYILKAKGREVANCELLSVARSFETEMLAWYSTLEGNKRRLDA